MRKRSLSRLLRKLTLGVPFCAFAVMLSPGVAVACPVCFDANDEARIVYLATTGLLTLLPLGMVAGVGSWIRRKYRDESGSETEKNPNST